MEKIKRENLSLNDIYGFIYYADTMMQEFRDGIPYVDESLYSMTKKP
jgi:hypothetical protein